MLLGKWITSQKAETILDKKITKNYPKLKIDRKNSRCITVQFSQK